MKNIYFLGYQSSEFDVIQSTLKTELKDYNLLTMTGKNINVKEFIRIKLKSVEETIDYFILDVSVLQNTDYTTVLSFKANIVDKYPELTSFLVIARQSDGLSSEEYNDIIRNSVNGKNYILISDSLVDDMCDNIISYIREHEGKEKLRNKGNDSSISENEISLRCVDKVSDNDSVRAIKDKNKTDKKFMKDKAVYGKEDREAISTDNSSFSYHQKLSDEALLVAEEIDEYNSDQLLKATINKNKKIWNGKDNTVIVFGAKKGIGTTFIAMSLALVLADEGAITSYVQLSKFPDLDEKAKDYSMFNAGEYYEYHNVFFVKNAFLNNINYHVIDLGDNYSRLKRAFELGWLDNKQFFLVGQGSTGGLKELDSCISKVSDIINEFNIIIVNPVFNEERYEVYEKFGFLSYFEYMKEPSDKKNYYNLSMIVDKLHEMSLEKQ